MAANNHFISCYAYDSENSSGATADNGFGFVEAGTGSVVSTKITNCIAKDFYAAANYFPGIDLDLTASLVGSSKIEADVPYMMDYNVLASGTANTVTVLNAMSGKTFTNYGADSIVTYDLPTPTTTGLIFTFVVQDTDGIYIEPGAASIYYNSMSAGDRLTSTTLGDTVTLRSIDASNWGVVAIVPGNGSFADAIWTDAN